MPHAYTLGFLELTFILVMILLLHSARRLIGNSGFYPVSYTHLRAHET